MSRGPAAIPTLPLLLGGDRVETGATEEVRAPYDGALIARATLAGAPEVERAIATGLEAFEETRRTPRHARRRVLRGIADGLRKDREGFAHSIAIEAGKPIVQARSEVDRAILTFELASEEIGRTGGESIPLDLEPRTEGYQGSVQRFPVGLVAGITPFNFPLNLVAHKAAPALAAGCALVLKPARKTPGTALRIATLALEAGAPAGAWNLLNCDRVLGDRLVTDVRFKLLSFTGSAAVGWEMKAKAGRKKVVLELGGNAAVIVEPDADLDWAVERCVAGGFYYAGQSCISVQRIFVQETIYDAFTERLLARITKLRVGDPLEEATEVGPVIDEENAARIVSWIAAAQERGARLLTGGGREGAMVAPAVLERVPKDTRLSCEEVFGPVVTLAQYKEFGEALEGVNDSVFGLQAGLFTHDIRRITQAFEALEVGGLIVGDVPTFRVDNYPYGGVKESGLGREGARYAIEEMTEPRMLVVNTRK